MRRWGRSWTGLEKIWRFLGKIDGIVQNLCSWRENSRNLPEKSFLSFFNSNHQSSSIDREDEIIAFIIVAKRWKTSYWFIICLWRLCCTKWLTKIHFGNLTFSHSSTQPFYRRITEESQQIKQTKAQDKDGNPIKWDETNRSIRVQILLRVQTFRKCQRMDRFCTKTVNSKGIMFNMNYLTKCRYDKDTHINSDIS